MTDIVHTFYDAFSRLDADTMCACYHDDATFYDHAFGELTTDRVQAMWQMLVASQRGKDFRISYGDIAHTDRKSLVRWEAHYTFSRTGRQVHNIINTEMQVQDGKIIHQVDHFDVHRWAGQALSWTGTLIGWTPFFRRKLQAQTKMTLDKWMANQTKS